MGLHRPMDRHFFVLGGATMTKGGSLNLAKGQLGIFDIKNGGKDGAPAVSNFKGVGKDCLYELKLGTGRDLVNRSRDNKPFSSFPFKISNIQGLKVSVPERKEQAVDEVLIGYNGIDASTSFQFHMGSRMKLFVELSGEAIGLLGYKKNKVQIPVYIDAPQCSPLRPNCKDCDPCKKVECLPLILDAIERLKRHQLRGGIKAEKYFTVTPIKKCNVVPTLTEIPYQFYSIKVCDTGDDNALGLLRTQYPDLHIERTGRTGVISTYEFVQDKKDGAPKDFEQTLASIMKGCADCPPEYKEAKGGYLYAYSLEDDGKEVAAPINTAFVAGTFKRHGGVDGVGVYTIIANKKLTRADIEALATGVYATIAMSLVGKAKDICNNSTIKKIKWVAGKECTMVEQEYIIDIPDNECGKDKLAELQAFYSDLVIEKEGTEGGCQTRFKTKVKSNLVCDECSPVFEDYYRTKAPGSYDGYNWKFSANNKEPQDCLCGIRIKGKVLEVHPSEDLIDQVGFIDSSVQIRVSGGYVTEVRADEDILDANLNIQYLSKKAPRTHLGGNLMDWERRGNTYFSGSFPHDDTVAKLLLNETSNININSQYVDYALTVRRDIYSNSFGGRSEDNVTYHVMVEVGRHLGVEELLNNLVAAAGKTPVQAFGK